MPVTVSRDPENDRVAHLRIDAGKLNLLSPAAISDIHDAATSVPDGVSVLTVGPDAYEGIDGLTAGLQLDAVKEYSASEARALIGTLRDAIAAVRNQDAVTVCACGEYALGAGLELAMACDFRVATDEAALGLPEIDAGLVTGIQGGLLIRLVGLQAAKEMVYTGEPVSGTDAAEMGLVNRAVPPETYDDTLDSLVGKLAEKSPVIARRQSEVFRAWRSTGIEAGIRHSRETIASCFDTHDQHEAMAAFLADRAPEFEGR